MVGLDLGKKMSLFYSYFTLITFNYFFLIFHQVEISGNKKFFSIVYSNNTRQSANSSASSAANPDFCHAIFTRICDILACLLPLLRQFTNKENKIP